MTQWWAWHYPLASRGGSLTYSYTVLLMQQHPDGTYRYIGVKLQPCLTSISNTDLVKVDCSQAILACLSTSSLPCYWFWSYRQSASQSLLRHSVRLAWKADRCSQIRNKVWHVYKSSWQFQNFLFSIIGVDIPLRCANPIMLLVPLWSQAESSLLVGTWVDMTVFADKHARDFWQKPGYWSITMLWISLQ